MLTVENTKDFRHSKGMKKVERSKCGNVIAWIDREGISRDNIYRFIQVT